MKIILKLIRYFTGKNRGSSMPLMIIKKEAANNNFKEYASIEEAIEELEKDTTVPAYKIEKLRLSLNRLKNKTSIKIKNGEIIK